MNRLSSRTAALALAVLSPVLATQPAAPSAARTQDDAEPTAPAPPSVGDPVPDFTLTDARGVRYRLRDARGKIVVLEWTNHLCPAVAGYTDSRIMADTRAAVSAPDAPGPSVLWWQVDSSWFAPLVTEEIGAWSEGTGFEGPLLLDTGGEVARALGAVATPHLFVIDGEGRLAYSGALHDRAPEAKRRNFVVDAVQALLDGRPVDTPSTTPLGCSIELERSSGVPENAGANEIDEDYGANERYRAAARAAASGDLQAALARLTEAVAESSSRAWPAWRLFSDPAFRNLLADGEKRNGIRALLGAHPPRGSVTIVAPDEPGEAMVLAGRVTDADGAPIDGAEVSLYQTDDAGWYRPGSNESDNPRLFGRVRTDRDGRYRIRTIVPGHYATASDGPAHFHVDYRAKGFVTHGGHRASIYFDDDPMLVGEALREITNDGCSVLPRSRNAEGVTLVVNDVRLRRE